MRPLRRRAAPPKLIALNNALLAATSSQGSPDLDDEPARFGAWVENACLAHAWNRGQKVMYWREEPLEVDAVIEGSWGSWAIEVKSAPFDLGALRGLLEFTRRFPRFRPLVLCTREGVATTRRAGVQAMAWAEFLLTRTELRPP